MENKIRKVSGAHGLSKHPLYSTWYNMIDRCENQENRNYKYYGARGIKVCKRWHNAGNFIKDMGNRPNKHSIDRTDNYKGYKPSNCRWATRTMQANNKRASHELTMANLAKFTGYTRERIRQLSGISKQKYPNILAPYFEQIIKTDKSIKIIYKPEAIEFLKNRRIEIMNYQPEPKKYYKSKYVYFDLWEFTKNHSIGLGTLSELLDTKTGSTIWSYFKLNRVKKAHLKKLEDAGFDINPYLQTRRALAETSNQQIREM